MPTAAAKNKVKLFAAGDYENMGEDGWNWRTREGGRGGLLYEPGNWGDLLKILWLSALLRWKTGGQSGVGYFDPFAGAVSYPLSGKARTRLEESGSGELDFIRPAFTDRGFWPSAASAAGLFPLAGRAVFDADAEKMAGWRKMPGVETLGGGSGWDILAERRTDPREVWLADPYDFLAEWRERLAAVLRVSRTVTLLLYVYNRSAGLAAGFETYRAFRRELELGRDGLPGRFGRTASDGFLPRAHHEMFLLPGRSDAADRDFAGLARELDRLTAELEAARRRSGLSGPC